METELDLDVLEPIVARYDELERPVTARELVGVLEPSQSVIADCLSELADNELLAPEGDGYRPTITARELLELDIDAKSSMVVLDFEPVECGTVAGRDDATDKDDP